MAADHPDRAARRVEQDPVERAAIPPVGRAGRIARDESRRQAEPVEVRADLVEPRAVAVEGTDLGEPGARLENVPGLAARRGARVEHALPRREIEELRRALRGDVLN